MPTCPDCRSFSMSQTLCDHCRRPLVDFAEGAAAHVAQLEGSIQEINQLLSSRQYRQAMQRCLETQAFLAEHLGDNPHARVQKARQNLDMAVARLKSLGVRPTRIVATSTVSIEEQAPQVLSALAILAAGSGACLAGLGLLLATVSGRLPLGVSLVLAGSALGVIGYLQRHWTWWAWLAYLWINIVVAVGALVWSAVSLAGSSDPRADAVSGFVVGLGSALIAWYVGTHLDGIRHHSK